MVGAKPPDDRAAISGPATLQRSPEDTPTVAGERTVAAAVEFVPGTVLLGRYRIVSSLGKGGMGEVYRADDLKLGQTVALKFLTPGKAVSERQKQLVDEVRLGRDVSHPNVCRLYDIGEVDGHLFISMEYIDGEDLASLLRRIGHLPGDKALALARDICAGLGAAHDRGIIHRDLKPGNIMIDGRGRARITDFGLARAEGHRDEEGKVSGTPTYMAPEQFEGKPATIASDLYAVGLILFEIWSGRRLVTGKSLTEIIAQHQNDTPRESLKSSPDIERPVAAVLEKCLARDPEARFTSARAILKALPGGDALDAAIAAGETPSPAMVAAASEKGDLSRAAAWSCLLVVVFGVLGIASLSQQTTLRGRVSMPYPPSHLDVRAQEMIAAIGWSDRDAPRVDQASFFGYDGDFLRWRARQPGRDSASLEQALRFQYRQSPRPMITEVRKWSHASRRDESGVVNVVTTADGRLRAFSIVPMSAPAATDSDAPWTRLFELANLEPASLVPSTPARIVPVDNDRKAAWTGRDPIDGTPIRIEAASLGGRVVWFSLIEPWNGAERRSMPALPDAIRSATLTAMFVAVPIAALLLARRNLRRGQGDKQGATRLALFILVTLTAGSLLRAHHVPDAQRIAGLTLLVFEQTLFIAVVVWFGYVAIEPFARRWWPKTLIAWSRLLEGRILDPMIGRDILVGMALGTVVAAIAHFTAIVPSWFGLDAPLPILTSMGGLSSFWGFAAALADRLTEAVVRAFGFMVILVLLRGLLRNRFAAIIATSAIACASTLEFVSGPIGIRIAAMLVIVAIALGLLFRFGLVAFAAETFFALIAYRFPLTLDPSSWYFGRSLFVMLLVASIALFAFWRALGAKPILPGPVFED